MMPIAVSAAMTDVLPSEVEVSTKSPTHASTLTCEAMLSVAGEAAVTIPSVDSAASTPSESEATSTTCDNATTRPSRRAAALAASPSSSLLLPPLEAPLLSPTASLSSDAAFARLLDTSTTSSLAKALASMDCITDDARLMTAVARLFDSRMVGGAITVTFS
jgi:hypothetical protein